MSNIGVDLKKYWESINDELIAAKDRVRNLIGSNHWLTDGSHKELLLNGILSRHLPENLKIGTGFICKDSATSKQIDILIVDKQAYTLFKEGDLLVVTPSAVRAIIEVKTRINNFTPVNGYNKIYNIILKLSQNTKLFSDSSAGGPHWSGLFVYEEYSDVDKILQAISKADQKTKATIDCISLGPNIFIKFWGKFPQSPDKVGWVVYNLKGLAPGYFIGNLIAEISKTSVEDDRHLFPIQEGKERYRTKYILRGENQVRTF